MRGARRPGRARPSDVSGLRISGNAHLIMPWHRDHRRRLRAAARARCRSARPGAASGRPTPTRRCASGIRVQDLLDEKILRAEDPDGALGQERELRKLHHHRPLDKDEMTVACSRYAERIAPYIADTSLISPRRSTAAQRCCARAPRARCSTSTTARIRSSRRPTRSAGGACVGLGVGPTRIGSVLGVTKAYLTRVGAGPFPSEADADAAEALRERGGEYGTVTGRARRCGWLDLVGLRYAARLNGLTELAVTKLDVLSMLDRDPGLHRLPPRRRLGQRASSRATRPTSTTPSRSGRRSRAGTSRSTARGISPTCRRRHSATWRSCPSASASRSGSSASARGAIRC